MKKNLKPWFPKWFIWSFFFFSIFYSADGNISESCDLIEPEKLMCFAAPEVSPLKLEVWSPSRTSFDKQVRQTTIHKTTLWKVSEKERNIPEISLLGPTPGARPGGVAWQWVPGGQATHMVQPGYEEPSCGLGT